MATGSHNPAGGGLKRHPVKRVTIMQVADGRTRAEGTERHRILSARRRSLDAGLMLMPHH